MCACQIINRGGKRKKKKERERKRKKKRGRLQMTARCRGGEPIEQPHQETAAQVCRT